MSAVLAFILTAPAWRPFLDPLDLHEPWHALLLLPPLVIGVSIVYKALKLHSLDHLAAEAARLSAYILALMIVAAVILYAIVELA